MEAVIEFITILIVLFINFNLIKTEESDNNEEKKVLKMFVEGIRYIRDKRALVFIIFFAMFINFLFASVSVGLPYVLINEIKISDYLYGIINAAFPVAVIVSSIILSMMDDIESPLEFSFKWLRCTAGVLLFLGIALLFKLSIFSYFIVFMIFAFGVNFVGNFVNTPVFVWLTKAVPHEYQGRVFSIIETGCQLLMPLGILFYSILFDNFKSANIFIISGIALMVLVVLPYILKVDLKTKEF